MSEIKSKTLTTSTVMFTGGGRDASVDFTKGVLISLMVLFHLTYFIEKMPNGTCGLVYTFHMPGFLVLSGFFCSMKNPVERLKKMARGILVPYILFESVYLLGLGMIGKLVGSNNTFELSAVNIAHAVSLSPVGTYWYLHTLVFCISIYAFFSMKFMSLSKVNALILASICCWGITFLINGLKWENCMYFFIGAYIRLLSVDIKKIVIPTWLSILGFVCLCFGVDAYNRYSLGGCFITFASLSCLFFLSKIVGHKLSYVFEKTGRNSLCIVLMSPFFMIPSKFYSRYFDFDPTGLLFGIFSLVTIIGLCMLFAVVLDKIGISKVVFGNKIFY